MNGAELIAAERQRQLLVEGYGPVHDDDHWYGELAVRAAELAVSGTDAEIIDHADRRSDAWGLVEKHENNRIRQLTIAGAMIAAEIDRLVRLDAVNQKTISNGDGPACAATHPAPAESPESSTQQDSRQ